MYTILTALMLGILAGNIANKKTHTVNETLFTILGTSLVVVMGISLGINRALFLEAKTLFLDSFIFSIVFSLGSIVSVALLTKLITKSNV